MALHPHGHQDAAARRADMLDAAHDRTEPAASRAMRRFLRQVLAQIRVTLSGNPAVTAAAGEVPPIARELFTIGQARDWWAAAISEDLLPALRAIWRAGYSDTSTTKASDDAVVDYLARVTDRLSPTAVPGLPDDAFTLARTVLTQALSSGASIPEISARLAAEFSWDDPAAYWRAQKAEAQAGIDAILDPLGEPGSYAREHAKRHDPQVAELRGRSNEATRHIDDVESAWRTRATRIARTETTGAFNAGAYQAYHDEGAAALMWVATLDARTRRTHKAADRQVRVLGQPFQVGRSLLLMPGDPSGPPGEIINCFPAETVVDFTSVRSVMRRWYSGDLVRVRLASGHELSGTPNHPVLGAHGWVPLGEVKEGDDLVYAALDGEHLRAPDVQNPPATIGEVYGAAARAGQSQWVVLAPPDLHGDGVDGEIEVVAVDGSLRFDGDPATDEQVEEFGLALADQARAGFGRLDDTGLRAPGVRLATVAAGVVRGERSGAALVRSHARGPEEVGLAVRAGDYAGGEEAGADPGSGETEVLRQGELRFPGPVTLDQVVEVDVVAFSGHVFNLDTGVGWYLANGTPARNCRCTTIAADVDVRVDDGAGGQ